MKNESTRSTEKETNSLHKYWEKNTSFSLKWIWRMWLCKQHYDVWCKTGTFHKSHWTHIDKC